MLTGIHPAVKMLTAVTFTEFKVGLNFLLGLTFLNRLFSYTHPDKLTECQNNKLNKLIKLCIKNYRK